MGVRDEAVQLLRSGKSPVEIAQSRGVTLSTVLGYLETMIGRGVIRRSDVYFSIPQASRDAIAGTLRVGLSTSRFAISSRLRRKGFAISDDEIEVVLRFWNAGNALGDMYEDVRAIEVKLHSLVRKVLEAKYGVTDSGWWRQGISSAIRGKCGQRRESDDSEPASHPFCYTDLLDLREIIEKQWPIFSVIWLKVDKKSLLRDLILLNEIRRSVMHPVRAAVPSEADFEFVRLLKVRLRLDGVLSKVGQA